MNPHQEAAILAPVLGRLLEAERETMFSDLPWIGRTVANKAWSILISWLPLIIEKCLTLFAARYGHVTLGDLAELMIAAAARLPADVRASMPPPPPRRE